MSERMLSMLEMGQLVCGLLMPDVMLDARLHTHVVCV